MRRLTDEEIRDTGEISTREQFDRDVSSNIGRFDSEYIHIAPVDELEEEMTPHTSEAPVTDLPDAQPTSPPDITHGPDPLSSGFSHLRL